MVMPEEFRIALTPFAIYRAIYLQSAVTRIIPSICETIWMTIPIVVRSFSTTSANFDDAVQ